MTSGVVRADQVGHRLGVAHVDLDQLGAGGDRALEVLAPAGGEVVENGHLVAPLEQGVDEVRADEAGAAGDQSPHRGADASVAAVSGLFVTLEGIDRSGKTTQAKLLIEALGDEAVGVREPGGTAAGERVRELLKDPAVELSGEAEALLFAAARAELVRQVIRPALDAGRVVVSDRFLDSSLAYQGAARGLGVDEVAAVNALATGGLRPDLTLLLDLDPEAAHARAGEEDRFEAEGAELQRAVARRLLGAGRRRPRALAADPRRAAARGGARRRAGRRARGPRGGARVSPLAGTEDHPHARMALESALAGGALARLSLPRPGRRGQGRGGARVRRRAAGRGRGRSRRRPPPGGDAASTPTSPGSRPPAPTRCAWRTWTSR